MMSSTLGLDAHEKPPNHLRSLYKRYQHCSAEELEHDSDVIDIQRVHENPLQLLQKAKFPIDTGIAFANFHGSPIKHSQPLDHCSQTFAFEVTNIPGLYLLPALIPEATQIALLDRLLHRDLSNPEHKTNVHLHHQILYPQSTGYAHASSFFSQDSSTTFHPLDPAIHKALTVAEFLQRKLRWLTLGGQYDWAAKCYPKESFQPLFPADIGRLVKDLFPATEAQAAIVNLYSPGDKLSLHRDVSEHCDQGLVSVSIGCDGIFIVGNSHDSEAAILRLRAGDVLYMTGPSRYAWHGIPRILPKTCPELLAAWPAVASHQSPFNQWKGWMGEKRVNLNVRQMNNKVR